MSLSPAYDRSVWGEEMGPFERMRDRLRSGETRFEYLDAAQLVKHAFGLVTDARRRNRKPALLYLYAEPSHLGGSPLAASAFQTHRDEIAAFGAEVSGAEVKFASTSYREWLSIWASYEPAVAEHALAIAREFEP